MPVTKSSDDRSAIAQAWAWSSQITAVALQMVLPGLVGLWIDRCLGTVMLFLVLGVIFGVVSGILHLLRLAKAFEDEE